MSKNKLQKFAALETFPNTFQNFEINSLNWEKAKLFNLKKEVKLNGKWKSDYFKNENPIILELACGRGEYTMAMSERFPNKNFIGVDIKGNRIWAGAKKAVEVNRTNVAFIRTRIELIDCFFDANEVSEIWITFADPFIAERRRRKRLTYTRFLELYQKIMVPNGPIHLKTDSDLLYEFTLEMIEENNCLLQQNIPNVYKSEEADALLTEVQTTYEKMHLEDNRIIKYLRFSLNEEKQG